MLLGAYGLRAGIAAPPALAAGTTEPTLVVRDEPLERPGARYPAAALAARPAPEFDMVGLHWRGPGHVYFRTRSLDRDWSSWRRAVVHEEANSAEAGNRCGWHLGTPVWTGGSDAIQYRIAGRVTRLQAHFVQSPSQPAGRVLLAADRPPIITRAAWHANEKIVRHKPQRANRLFLAIVHHTAGRQPASPAESAAIVRAIQIYHVKSNRWNDIGYNFLVDRFGQVFEGRAGGIHHNIVGAHALGFNTGTTGVAILGNFQRKRESAQAGTALAALLAWRLDVGHVDPVAEVDYLSGGRFHRLRAVSGHRDVNRTDCPGNRLYGDLDAIAVAAGARGLPKLYDPTIDRSEAGSARFTARLSTELRWKVTVTDRSDTVLATGEGRGSTIDWTWPIDSVPDGKYRYTMEAGDVRPATGTLKLGPRRRSA